MAGTLSSSSTTEVVMDDAPKLRTRTSLSSIVVGALVAISVGILLHLLATAVGFASVDTVDRDTPAAGTFALMVGAWSLVANIVALGIGGYVAARLSGNMDRQDAALHGLAVWGAAVGVSFVVGGLVAAGAATATTSAIGSIVGGAAQGAGNVAASVAGPAAADATSRMDANTLAGQLRATLSAPTDPQRMTTEQRGAEIAALIGKRVANASFASGERERLSALIAAEAGISAAEADQRIAAYEQQARETAARAEQRAREAADAAASATSIASFWMFAALLMGGAAAVIGALQGARDGRVLVRSSLP